MSPSPTPIDFGWANGSTWLTDIPFRYLHTHITWFQPLALEDPFPDTDVREINPQINAGTRSRQPLIALSVGSAEYIRNMREMKSEMSERLSTPQFVQLRVTVPQFATVQKSATHRCQAL